MRVVAVLIGLMIAAVVCIVIAAEGISSPVTVVGHFTGPSMVTGQPDYYEMLSDGSYIPVPWGIYSTAPYGSTLSYSHSSWSYQAPRNARLAPDVDYSTWKSAKRTTISTYTGMSSKVKGITVYKASSGYTFRSARAR